MNAGLVESTNSKSIVEFRVQLAMLGAAQQALSYKEELDQQWQDDQLRIQENQDSQWTHALSKKWWKLDKNIKYFIEVCEELVVQSNCFEELSTPYTSENLLKKYYAVGLKLRRLA